MSFIELHYGPYLEGGIITHRTNRLMNVVNYLQKKGNSVELIPSIHFDTLEVIIGLRVAFRCRITFLSQLNYEVFGVGHDPTFIRAIQAIEETLGRMGQVTANIKVPGVYKGMFSISQDFGSGILHNNFPDMMSKVMVEEEEEDDDDDDDDDDTDRTDRRPPTNIQFKKSIKFLTF